MRAASFALLVSLLAAGLGCKGGKGAVDAAATDGFDAGLRDGPCTPGDVIEGQCTSQFEGWPCYSSSAACASTRCSCQCGRCLPGCPGNPTGIPCGSWSNPQMECCGSGWHCCDLTTGGMEHERCYPLSQECPRVCAGGYHGAAWLCPRDSWCVHAIWEPWTAPPDGTCSETWTQDPSSPEPMGCATDCPTESQCGGGVCCGAHTRCALTDGGTSCCVADWPELWADAGTPDGGLTAAGQPD